MVELQDEPKTVPVKACTACTSGLLETDKFCRWCGARQPYPAPALGRAEDTARDPGLYGMVYLSPNGRTSVYHRISAPLVDAVVTSALAGPSRSSQGAFAKRLILALISIPVWLIIVLLSPLDAYAAVKNLAR